MIRQNFAPAFERGLEMGEIGDQETAMERATIGRADGGVQCDDRSAGEIPKFAAAAAPSTPVLRGRPSGSLGCWVDYGIE
jgi:hypothetical protein